MPATELLDVDQRTAIQNMPVRQKIIHCALEEMRQSNNGTPTQMQMNKYLTAAGLYPLNRDGTWPSMAVRYLWNGWCGIFALYCMKQAGVPDLKWFQNHIPMPGQPQRMAWGICGPRARVATSDGHGGFKLINGGDAVIPRMGDAAICGGDGGSHHILVWMPKYKDARYSGFEFICGNGKPEGRLPMAIDKKGKVVPPLYQTDGVPRVLKGYILSDYIPIESISAIYSLDLDGI